MIAELTSPEFLPDFSALQGDRKLFRWIVASSRGLLPMNLRGASRMPDRGDKGQEARYFSSTLNQIAEVIGNDATIALVKAIPGQNLYIPKTINSDHRIAQAIGMEASKALSAVFGGDRVELPATIKPQAKTKVQQLADDGKSVREISVSLGVTQRWVRKVLYAGQPFVFGRMRQRVLEETGTAAEIAARLGLNETRVAAVLKRYRGDNQ